MTRDNLSSPGARLKQLLLRKDKVLVVLHPPTATQTDEKAGASRLFSYIKVAPWLAE